MVISIELIISCNRCVGTDDRFEDMCRFCWVVGRRMGRGVVLMIVFPNGWRYPFEVIGGALRELWARGSLEGLFHLCCDLLVVIRPHLW